MLRPLIFVMTSLAPTGGVERDALKCLDALSKQGRKLFVIAARLHPDVPKMFPEGTVLWYPISSPRRPAVLNYLWLWFRSRRIIKLIRRDYKTALVLSFEWLPMCDVQIGAMPTRLWWEARKKMHKLTWNRPLTRLWTSFVEHLLKQGNCRFIVYSKVAYLAFQEDGVTAERIDRVIIPTDLERFSPSETPLAERSEILLIGSDPINKGVDIALMAWPAIRKAYPHLTLNIVCNKRKTPRLASRFDLTNVTLSPLISNPEAYYAKAAMLLAPSMFESWGNVVVEATACGIPVITTQQTPSSELISQPAFGEILKRSSNPIKDAESLRDAILRLLQRDESKTDMDARHAHAKSFQQSQPDIVTWATCL